jgi:ABC-type branched-subunit amino acid transport system ATPase component
MLELKATSRYFGGLQALHQVNMQIAEGTIVGLIGPNGAGKTTLINCVTGLDHPTSGQIVFQDTSIEHRAPHRIMALGLARTYQNIRLFAEMTVLDNVIVAQHRFGWSTLLHSLVQLPSHRREHREQQSFALELLERFHLWEMQDVKAGNLPYGDQRRLEMARALATRPQMVLLDEPTAGMNPRETQELGDQILRMKADGLTLLVVEHDMALISQVCDAVYVLNFGQIIAYDTVANIKQNEAVIEAYLGREA